MKRREVIIASVASDDLAVLLERSTMTHGFEAANRLDERLDSAISSLARLGDRGRLVPELRSAGITSYREVLVAPFRIIYRVEPSEIWVVAVVDRRRNLEELLFERVRGRVEL